MVTWRKIVEVSSIVKIRSRLASSLLEVSLSGKLWIVFPKPDGLQAVGPIGHINYVADHLTFSRKSFSRIARLNSAWAESKA